MEDPSKPDYSAAANGMTQPKSGRETQRPESLRLASRPLPKGYEAAQWSQTSPEVINQIRTAARQGQWPVYLQGKTGVGKSFAAALVYQTWRHPRPESCAIWFSLTQLCETLNAYRIAEVQTFMVRGKPLELTLVGFWARLRDAALVVVDELGTRRASDHRYDTLLEVLDLRKGRPLILTGNLDEAAIASAYDERVLSRISEGVMINCLGEDRRLIGVDERFHVVE